MSLGLTKCAPTASIDQHDWARWSSANCLTLPPGLRIASAIKLFQLIHMLTTATDLPQTPSSINHLRCSPRFNYRMNALSAPFSDFPSQIRSYISTDHHIDRQTFRRLAKESFECCDTFTFGGSRPVCLSTNSSAHKVTKIGKTNIGMS